MKGLVQEYTEKNIRLQSWRSHASCVHSIENTSFLVTDIQEILLVRLEGSWSTRTT